MKQYESTHSTVQVEGAARALPFDLTAEFSLPDYQSEISRLLWVRPTLLPPECFIGGGKAEFSGQMYFNVLYCGPDGALYSTVLNEGYSFSLPTEGEIAELVARVTPDSMTARVTGPRKLSLRCRLHARVGTLQEKDVGTRMRGEGERAEAICRLSQAMEARRLFTGGRKSVTLTDIIEDLPLEETTRIIGCRTEVFLPDVTAGKEVVRCRGEALLTLLLCREGEDTSALTFTHKIPFEADVPLEGASPNCRALAEGFAGEVSLSREEGELSATLDITVFAEAEGCEPVVVCRDLFLPGSRAEYHFSEEVFSLGVACMNQHLTLSQKASFAELGIPAGAEIIDATADVQIREEKKEGEKTALLGQLICHILYRFEKEYAVATATLPLRAVIDAPLEESVISPRICECRAESTREGVQIVSELQLALRSACRIPTKALTEVIFSPEEETPHRADVEICYPAREETLWDVAKRYAVSPTALAAANGIQAESPAAKDSLLGTKCLFIP